MGIGIAVGLLLLIILITVSAILARKRCVDPTKLELQTMQHELRETAQALALHVEEAEAKMNKKERSQLNQDPDEGYTDARSRPSGPSVDPDDDYTEASIC